MRLTTEQLELRRPVWIALADLYLDTDVRLNYASTAWALANSPFDETELEAICRDEVEPIVGSNLLSVAGEWACFDPDWLVECIVERLSSRWHLPHIPLSVAKRDIRAVFVLASRLRRLPSGQREARFWVWHCLSDLFLSRDCPLNETRRKRLAEFRLSAAQLDEIFNAEMMPSYGESIEPYFKDNPKMYPDRAGVLANFVEWRATLSTK